MRFSEISHRKAPPYRGRVNPESRRDLEVLYEDNHLLAVVKPAGLLTQGDRTGDDSLLERAREWLKQKYQKPGKVFLGLVHRLDRPASGVVIFGKTSKAASRLSEAFRTREVEKRYLLLVTGMAPGAGGTLEHYIGAEAETRVQRLATEPAEGLKRAVLEYKTRQIREGVSMVEVQLHTGRKHQIRAQMAGIGAPILGDSLYGGRRWRGEGIALHASRLVVPHPTTKVPIILVSDPKWSH